MNHLLGEINLNSTPSKGTESIVNNTKILYDILTDFYPVDTLQMIFTKEQTLSYLGKLEAIPIHSKMQAESLKDDINFYFSELAFLNRIVPEYSDIRTRAEAMVRDKFE